MGTAQNRFAHRPTGIRSRTAGAVTVLGFLLLGGLLLSVTSVDIGMDIGPHAWAQTSNSDSLATFRSGRVTDIRGKTVQIDKQEYTLDPNVVIKDDEGKPRGLKDIDPGAEVRFHLKHGRVDQLVLVLPK